MPGPLLLSSHGVNKWERFIRLMGKTERKEAEGVKGERKRGSNTSASFQLSRNADVLCSYVDMALVLATF